MNIWTLFKLGGIFMWPLAFFLFVLIFAVIERSISFTLFDFRCDISFIRKNVLSEQIIDFQRNKFYCVLHECYFSQKDNYEKFDKIMTNECQEITDKLRHNLSLISGVGTIAPVTGFLGTVTGMINVFSSISGASDVTPQLVASGIYEALITTAAGLIISIIASVCYYIFNRIILDYSGKIEHCVNEIIKSDLKK